MSAQPPVPMQPLLQQQQPGMLQHHLSPEGGTVPGRGARAWAGPEGLAAVAGLLLCPPLLLSQKGEDRGGQIPSMPFLVVIVTPNPVVSPFKRPGSFHLGRDMA